MQNSESDKRLICNLCQKDFDVVGDLIRHFKYKHYACSLFICNNCSRKYSHVESFRYHLHNCTSIISSIDDVNQNNSVESESIETALHETIEILPALGVETTLKEIRHNFLKHFLKIYSNEKTPRKIAISNTKEITSFYKPYLLHIQSEIQCSNWIENSSKISLLHLIENMLEITELQSEYKILQELRKTIYFFDVDYYNIHDELIETVNIDNSIILNEINYVVGIFPLQKLFTTLFNETSFLREIVLYYQSLRSQDTISNYVQSNHWKEILSQLPDSSTVFYLPMLIFNDDFEPNNSLGSHAGIQKICGVYVKFACLPDHMSSKICNTFIGMLLFSEDRKKFGNRRVFKPFIDYMNLLQSEGIKLQTEVEGYKTIKIISVLMVGDNLGLNTVLGFTQSFNSKFFCRFCKMEKLETQNSCEENSNVLRNKDNYEEDVRVGNYKLTGIKESSVWNKLSNFHVINNKSVDVMHDLLEGVCHYDLILIFDLFITKYNLFTLEQLNYRILTFNYGPNCKNKPPILNSDSLGKIKLKLSASEMKSLSVNLSLIIGDLIPDCEEWSLYLLLREILSLCCNSDVVHINAHSLLSNLIQEHNQMYLKLSENNLKPKYHNLTHYGRIMAEVGPLKHLSSIRFEAFHQPLKKTAAVCNSRVNLIKTIFTKYQLNVVNLLLNYNELNANKIEASFHKCSQKLVEKFHLPEQFPLTNQVTIKNVLYKKQMVVQIGSYDDEMPQFGLILHIACGNPQIYLCLQTIKTHGFDSHYYAFKVELNKEFVSVAVDTLTTKFNSYLVTNNEKKSFVNWI